MIAPRSITLRHSFQSLRELDVVDRGVDGGERAEHALSPSPVRRRVALRIECLGLRHAARHPEDDHGSAVAGPAFRADQLRLATGQAASVAPAVTPMNPRRLKSSMRCLSILLRVKLQLPPGPHTDDQLKFRCHHYTPQKICEPIRRGFLRSGGVGSRQRRLICHHDAFRRLLARGPAHTSKPARHRFANSLKRADRAARESLDSAESGGPSRGLPVPKT